MSFKDKLKGWGLVEDDGTSEDSQKVIDPTKDLSGQMPTGTKPLPFAPVPPVGNYSAQPTINSANMFQQGPVLTDEDKQKWSDYAMGIYTKARGNNTIYNELITSFEALATMPGMGDTQKFQAAGQMLHAKYSKQQMLAAATDALNFIMKAKDEFDASMIDRQKIGIQDPTDLIAEKNKQIAQKQQEILDLQNDVITLNQTIADNGNKLIIRTNGFTMFFNQLVSKLQNDINNINSLISE